MNRRIACSLLLALSAGLVVTPALPAAEPQPFSITVENMHCAVCAKKVSDRLKAVVGVQAVQTDVKSGMAVVTPTTAKNPSPKALWEAVERAGFKPIKLVGPNGTFTGKPRV